MRDQRGETRQRAELQRPLVLPQERPQQGQSFWQDGRQVDLDKTDKNSEEKRGGGWEPFFF